LKKTERIEIRVTPEEKMIITLKSKQANQSISEFIIKSSTGNKIVVINELPEMITELRRIGNNINQLTRLANSRVITCVDLEGTKKELQKLWQSLNLLTTKLV
jgi:uncharacterized protein (DUF1778 family)